MTRPTKGRAIFPVWPDEDPLVDQLTPEERERLAAMALLSDSAFLAHVAYKLMNRIEALDRYYDGLCDRLSQRLDGVEVEDDAEREIRLATERREAENKRMHDGLARDLAYREQQRRWLLAVTPRPQHPAPGGWL